MSRLARDGTAEPVSRDQILRHAPVSKYQIQPDYGDEQAGAGRDG